MNKTATLNMTGILSCFICVILGFYSTSGQLWEKETLRNITVCDFNTDTNLTCSENEMIALQSLQYAYNVRCETTCCNTYTSTDCFFNATSSDIQELRRKCSGKPTCTLPSPPSTLEFCSLGTKTTSYMFLQYYCIPKTRVSSICSSGAKLTSDAEPSYLTNANYPGVTTGGEPCSCSLEVFSCTSGINLYTFDADLYLDTVTCEQNIAFLDGTNQTLHTIGCENHYSYQVESRQVNSHYMKINFINNSTSNQEGYFFIGLDATEAGASFSLSCTFEQESWCTGCGNVPVISNGQIDLVDVNNSSYGALATVTCASGYETNTPTISCLANNSWADAACTEKAACTSDEWRCSNGDCIPSNARCDNSPDCTDQSDEGNCNAVTCPEGLESCPHGNGSDVCVDKAVRCSCGAVSTILHGVINSDNNTIGSSAVVYCDDGYEASKPNVTCQTTGLWETATCDAKDCGTLPQINFGELKLSDTGSTTFGSSAGVVCATGYSPDKQSITCQSSGIWESAVCTIIDCGPIPNVDHGSVRLNQTNWTTYAAVAYVTCDLGYKPKQETLMCQATGTWETPACDVNTPKGKPTEDKNDDKDTLIIILVVAAVVFFLGQLVVMCFLQLKIHDIEIKAKGKDTEVHKRIAMTILGSIPILGLIPIYFTSRVFYEEVYHVTPTQPRGKSTENKAFDNKTYSVGSLDTNEVNPGIVHHDDIKIEHNMKAETTQMTEINGTLDNTDQREELSSGNSDTLTYKDSNNEK